MSNYSDNSNFSTLVQLLRYRAMLQPEQKAFTFLRDLETENVSLSYYELDQQSQKIAAYLQSLDASGERALLLYPPGLEFIAAFFGCLYAGVVAVPAYPPRPNQSLSRLQAIAADAQAKIVLTTKAVLDNLKPQLTQLHNLQALHWLTTDNITNNLVKAWQEPAVNRDTLAFLQYTSGSTGKPKGVMVTHKNLLHNSADLDLGWEHTLDSVIVTWLPHFHDMGLVYGIIQPLYKGFPCYMMAPISFIQRPIQWLQAISRYKATHSAAPNFAYELCVSKIVPEQCSTLDLNSWCVAVNGAEPVRQETLERFNAAFQPYGFRARTFCPGYGLAEATLKVTAARKIDLPVCHSFQLHALQQNRLVEVSEQQQGAHKLVGCGHPMLDTKIAIVHPQFLTRCAPDEVGEIWVSSFSVTKGYWNRPEETKQSFQAYLADTREGPFLRTGDLGFMKDGELFITGRIKDLLIIRGRNHYPQDIELTAHKSHPALRPSCSAAFSVEVEGEEHLLIACEVERSYIRNLDVDEVAGAIRRAVSEEHDLQVYAVLLLKTGSIPKTSSGKIQRHACRSGWVLNSLSLVGSSVLKYSDNLVEDNTVTPDTSLVTVRTQRQLLLELDLRNQIARILKISPDQLNPQQALITLGLDSLKAVEIKHYLEANFGLVLPMEAFLEDINISQLATQILSQAMLPSPIPLSSGTVTVQTITQVTSVEKQTEPDNAAQRQNLNTKTDIQFSLFYFSSNEAEFTDDKYRLLIEGAKFADQHGFTAVWIPERHFHAFGGIYANPSVLGAALAMVTERIRIRAGSVVLPLQNPIRVAEEWSIVDNLSKGRVDIAFAKGWNPNDFVLAPENYANRTEVMFSGIQKVQQFWRGETVLLPNGDGKQTEIKIYPLPKQQELTVWMTCSGGKERFIEAGAFGANILTALLFQPIEELAEKIALYRDSRAKHGYAPEAGHVTLMLHTFVGEDMGVVRHNVREPFTEYLQSSVDLWRHGLKSLDDLTEKEREDLLNYAFERFFQRSALFGTPDTCSEMVTRLKEIGVNEIACLIDFGVDVDEVIASLSSLKRLKEYCNVGVNPAGKKNGHQHNQVGITNTIDQENAEQLLTKLDQLSQQEVDSLLSELLVAREAGK